jgi:2-methylisocitrate lyase-like PEP mutase family enzyme
MNLEDASEDSSKPLLDTVHQVERIQAARSAASALGIPLVINARTDVYLLAVGKETERLANTIRRANAYRDAGADCLFVPGVRDAPTIATLAKEIRGPINVLAGPGTPALKDLQQLGVARVSMGSGPMRAALTLTRRIAQELRTEGTYDLFTRDVITHAEVNKLMSQRGMP